jgi:polysaccharide deacetylase family protein (PEP-CTERM system associated)
MILRNQSSNSKMFSCLTIDVEDWFHILDSSAVPDIAYWPSLESRIEKNLDNLLIFLDSLSVKVTLFWLGWLAERHKDLVRKCQDAGHEIASHGYAHVLAYKVGMKAFRRDISDAKQILEDITGEPIRGFRAAGFGITEKADWAFDVIKEAGYEYDSSVFPASRGHGGIPNSPLGPYFIETRSGHLLEIPMSVVKILGYRTSFFGGGYLRLANIRTIKWGIDRLLAANQPLIVYVHPRELDPDHPRLPLSLLRKFKSYVNLNSTFPKLKWLCETYPFYTMLQMVENYIKSFYLDSRVVPVLRLRENKASDHSPLRSIRNLPLDRDAFRDRLLLVEREMASFLNVQTLHSHATAELEVTSSV